MAFDVMQVTKSIFQLKQT